MFFIFIFLARFRVEFVFCNLFWLAMHVEIRPILRIGKDFGLASLATSITVWTLQGTLSSIIKKYATYIYLLRMSFGSGMKEKVAVKEHVWQENSVH